MATLTGRSPKDTYGDLLQVSNANDGVDSTLRFVSDGKGTNSSFKISSSSAQFTGTLTSTGLMTTTAGIVSGSDIISDTDSTDDLGSTGVRWANLWTDNITMGGTIAGAVGTFSSTMTISGLTTIASLKGTGAVTVTDILDEDNMASDSATKLATQQSIKAYVDAQVDTVDTLSEVLALGNTSGSTDIVVTAGQSITTNTIDETTSATGVTIDSVLVKDSTVKAGTLTIGAGSVTDSSGAITFGNENLVTTGTLGSGALTSSGIVKAGSTTQIAPHANADNFVADTAGHSGMSIMSGATSNGSIFFGDSGNNAIGQINYSHDTNQLGFRNNGVTSFTMEADGSASFAGDVNIGASGEMVMSRVDGLLVMGTGTKPAAQISSSETMLYIEDTSATTICLNNTGASGENWRLFTNTSGDFKINNQANGDLITVAAGGDTTFAGNINAVAGGINLGATGSANLLDDYEEGSWTPTMFGGTTAGSYTAGISHGTYEKIGRQVTVRCRMASISGSSGVGNLYMSGLPFNYANGSAVTCSVAANYLNTTTAAPIGLAMIGITSGSGNELAIAEMRDDAAWTNPLITNVDGSTDIRFVLTYYT